MLMKQKTFRLFTNYFSALNSHRHQDKAMIMAYMTHNDTYFGGLHTLHQPVAKTVPFLRGSNAVSVGNASSGAGFGFRIGSGGGSGGGLQIRGCSGTQKSANDRKPCAFVAPHHQLVREFEGRLDGSSSSSSNSLSAGYVNGHVTCQGGKLVGFPDYPLTRKIVVAVDVDEVIGNFVLALNRFIADRYSSNHSVSEYHVYEFFKIWNCSRDEADICVHEFFKTPYFKSGTYPLPGAQKVLHKLSRHCKLSVVTSRQNVIKDHTIEWIAKHYPGVFQEIHFGNHFALDGESIPKSEICRSLGATVLIDDNPRYAIECAEVGIQVLLFDYENSYPWCKTNLVHQHPLVTKVHNWEQVEQKLVSWIS